MDILSVLALISIFVIIGIGIALDPTLGLNFEALSYFLDYPSLFIVIIGTQVTAFIAFPFHQVKHCLKAGGGAFKAKNSLLIENLLTIIDIAKLARKNILGIEDALPGIENNLLRSGLRMIVDRAERDFINRMVTIEINNQYEEKTQGVMFFRLLGSMSPAFGMIGTLIGLVVLLNNLGDTAKIGPAMSVALITTFYGTLMSNAIYIPISNKLKAYRDEGHNLNKMIMEGLLLIEKSERPEHIEQALVSFFPSYIKTEYEEYKYGAS